MRLIMLTLNWKEEVFLEYEDRPDEIGRETARRYKVPWSSMWDHKKRIQEGSYSVDDCGPKVLAFDLETSPIKGDVWGLWENNVYLDQIREDWFLLYFSAVWVNEEDGEGQGEVISYGINQDEGYGPNYMDDFQLTLRLRNLLDEADLAVAHNGFRFDKGKFNARCLYHGIPAPSPYHLVDTRRIAAQSFKFTSNKLDYLATYLGFDNKISHEGHMLWVRCIAGDSEAWEVMAEYGDYDTVLLKDVYLRLRGWANTHPNVAAYYRNPEGRCTLCGSTDLNHLDTLTRKGRGAYNTIMCNNCGSYNLSTKNLLDKDYRNVLLKKA